MSDQYRYTRKPGLPLWILRAFIVRRTYDHSAIGDLQELYTDKVHQRGRMHAALWLWKQVLRSVPSFTKESICWGCIMFKNYLKVAIRNVAKQKVYTLINITGLALGMACCILILLWVQDELSYDTFHKKGNDLYRLVITIEERRTASSPWALVPTLKKDFPEIIKGSWYSERTMSVRYQENAYYEIFGLVDPEFLVMFTFPFIKGDPRTAFSSPNSVVMTEKTAKKYFGDDDPIGHVVNFDNRIDLVVTGVIQNIPSNSHLQFDCLAHPAHLYGEQRLQTWSSDCPSYVMLHSSADPEEVTQKISGTINKYNTSTNYLFFVSLQPLRKIHLYALNGTDPIVYVYLFSAIAVIILLIACINFMNLSTARSTKRAREVGMRKVVGAARVDIIRQFFGESILLSVLALCLAVVSVYLILPTFNTLASKQLTLSAVGNIRIVVGIALIALFTGIISGVYPALFLSAFQPVTVLQSSFVKDSRGRLFRKALIIVQFTASIALIIATTVIFKQMNYIRTKDLGFNREHIITIRTKRAIRTKYDTIKQELLKNKDILIVSAASSIPLNINNNNPVYWEGRSIETYERMNFVCVDYDYFETFGMNMAYGRSFSRQYATDIENYIINESALKLTGYEDPIGRMFSMWTDEGEIIGVVKDFHGTSLHNDIRPIVFVLYKNLPYFNMFIRMNTANMSKNIEFVKNTMERIVPSIIFQYTFLDDDFQRQYTNEERLGRIIEYFTILAIFISCLGLFGLASFMVEQRTKEIAIRKVLGATHAGIAGIFSKEFVILIAFANALAWPLAYYFMNKWIQNYRFHARIELWLFALAGLAALGIALFTVSYQTMKAARANPVDALKYE